jgi:hypothetical protein
MPSICRQPLGSVYSNRRRVFASASCLRVRSTAPTTPGPNAVGWWWGAVLRRVNPSVPSARNRVTYL